MNALMMKGAEVSPETSPRHLRVVMSATMTDVSSCRPLEKGQPYCTGDTACTDNSRVSAVDWMSVEG